MATKCLTPIKARELRVVRLNECGVPVTGAGSQIVTRGYIQAAVALEYEDGTEFLQKTAFGEPCVNQKDFSFLKRATVTIDWCVIDPDLIVILTGETLVTGGAPVTGTGVWFSEDVLDARFSLELWQPAAGTGACEAGGVSNYAYWAFFNMGNTKIGNFTFANGTFTFQTISETQVASTSWGTGPGTGTKWLPNGVTAGKHMVFNITTTAPPAQTGCGAVSLT